MMNALYLTLWLISAATLAFQITLTRFFSLSQGSHLAFMAISLALLGAGASGTYLFLRKSTATNLPAILTRGALLFTLSLPLSYLAINYSPFDAYRLAWEQSQLLWLLLYYLALTVPFFFGGLVVGAALTAYTKQAGPIYAANLIGAGFGPPLALLSLSIVGGPGTVFLCALLGWLGYGSSTRYQVPSTKDQRPRTKDQGPRTKRQVPRTTHHAPRRRRHASATHLPRLTLYLIITIALLFFTLQPPPLFDVRLTPYKSLSQALLYPGSEVILRQWNAFSRVDVLQSEGIRSAPGLSFTYPGNIPSQLGLTVDGDNLSPLTDPSDSEFTQYLPLALAFQLRPGADVLILEPGGGLAVLTALQNGAGAVTVVQSNHTVARAVRQNFADFRGDLYSDLRVTLIIDEPRSFLRRTDQEFDLIILPLTDGFRPVTAGAYTLNEDYRYTVEAFADALDHLSADGLLVVERWLQLPPSESLRLWGTTLAALHQARSADFSLPRLASQLAALRTLQTSLIIAAPASLWAPDLATIRQFANERQYDLVWLPDLQSTEANRFSIVPDATYHRTFTDLLTAPDPAAFFAAYPHAVAPPTDDHPYFFHFFKWQQTPEILQTLGKTWQPFGGSGYLVLVILLVLVVILSTGLILLPLLVMRIGSGARAEGCQEKETPLPPHPSTPLLIRYLLYFALLGLGFLFVEIPLLQHFILYLGQPAYAFAVVVSTLLVASGVGSGYLSGRLSLRWVLPMIAALAIVYPFLLPPLFKATLWLPFAGRVAVTVVGLVPLGLLLGIPFPRGLQLVGQTMPAFIPWVWAVNGCASVVSAVLAAMIALTWGFSAVLWGAAAAYGLAGVVIIPVVISDDQRERESQAPLRLS